jgi:hypothetical protein
MYGRPCAGCEAGGMCDGWVAGCLDGTCGAERDSWDERTGDHEDTDREDFQ